MTDKTGNVIPFPEGGRAGISSVGRHTHDPLTGQAIRSFDISSAAIDQEPDNSVSSKSLMQKVGEIGFLSVIGVSGIINGWVIASVVQGTEVTEPSPAKIASAAICALAFTGGTVVSMKSKSTP